MGQCMGSTPLEGVSQPSSERNNGSRRRTTTTTTTTATRKPVLSTTSPEVHIIDLLAAGILSMAQTGQNRCIMCENLRHYGSSIENIVRSTVAVPLYVCANCSSGFGSEVLPNDTNSVFTAGWLAQHRKLKLASKIQPNDIANYLTISSVHNHRKLYGTTSEGRTHHSASDCAICDEELKDSNFFVVLPCRHGFHKRCISPWFEGDRTCPVCRTAIPSSFSISSSDELVNAYNENELKKKWDMLCFYCTTMEEVEDMHGCSYLSDEADEDDAVLLGREKSRSVTVCSECHTDDSNVDMPTVVELGSNHASSFGFSFGRQKRCHTQVLEELALDETTMDSPRGGSCRLSISAIVYPSSESEKSIDLSDIKFDDHHISSIKSLDDTDHEEVDMQTAIANLVTRKKILAEKICFMIENKKYRIEKRETKIPPSPAEYGGTFCTVTLDVPTHKCTITSRGIEYVITMESA